MYETQIRLHTISSGGQNNASERGKLLEAFHAWLVRNGMANLLSLPELEKLEFRIMYDTLDEWVVISPKGGARIIFKRETGRYDRFPFVYLDDPTTEAFFKAARHMLSCSDIPQSPS